MRFPARALTFVREGEYAPLAAFWSSYRPCPWQQEGGRSILLDVHVPRTRRFDARRLEAPAATGSCSVLLWHRIELNTVIWYEHRYF